MALILASASPRRRELLPALGLDFDIRPADLDEASEEPDPARRASRLALRKAHALAAAHPAAAVIGADTIVALDGRTLGKPSDAEEATAMLTALRGRTHEVVTAVAVVSGGRTAAEAVTTAVTMRDYADDEIARYVARGEPLDKAGGYAIQDPELAPAASIDGCRCAVIGLPLWTLRTLLAAAAAIEAQPPGPRSLRDLPAARLARGARASPG